MIINVCLYILTHKYILIVINISLLNCEAGMVVHVFNPNKLSSSTWETEAIRFLSVWVQPGVKREFQANWHIKGIIYKNHIYTCICMYVYNVYIYINFIKVKPIHYKMLRLLLLSSPFYWTYISRALWVF